jgi:hypothetical protein
MFLPINGFYKKIATTEPDGAVDDLVTRLCAMIEDGCETRTDTDRRTFYLDRELVRRRAGCGDRVRRPADTPSGRRARRGNPAGRRRAGQRRGYRLQHRTPALGGRLSGLPPPASPRLGAEQVAAFLTRDPNFPRSLACKTGEAEEQLGRPRRHHGLRRSAATLERVEAIRDELEVREVRTLIAAIGVRRFDDHVPRNLIALAELLDRSFFDRATPGAEQARS